MASTLYNGTASSMATCLGSENMIPLDSFLASEKDEMSALSEVIERSVTQQVHSLLKLLDYEDHELEEMTREILYEGMEIYENCEEQSENVIELNSLKDWYIQLLYDRCALLLFAPGGKSGTTLQEDDIVRRSQFENLCKLYPGLSSDAEKNPSKIVDVRCYSDILNAVQEFLKEAAIHSKKVLIYINGRGENKGIQLANESTPLGLDRVIADIKTLVQATKANESGTQEMQEYQIVFGNTYSHSFCEPHLDGIFEVIPLSSEARPKTIFTLTRNTDVGVVDSKHHGCNGYARQAQDMALPNLKPLSLGQSIVLSTEGGAEQMEIEN